MRFAWLCALSPCFVLMAVACASVKKSDRPPLVTRTKVMMGTIISISVPADSVAAVAPAFEQFRRVETALSSYDAQSEISQLNKWGRAELSPLALQALKVSLELAALTEGAFDPTVGALTESAYAFGRAEARLPARREVERARRLVGFQLVNVSGAKVTLPRGMKLDLGGIGKGFAVDLAVEELRRAGLTSGVVAASGDIYCLHACAAAVAHPLRREEQMAEFELAQGALALSTSATSERKVPGSDAHHLLDPQSGKPARGLLSLTLVGALSAAELDGLATGVFVMGEERATQFLAARPHIGFLLVTDRGEALINERFSELTHNFRWLAQADFKIRKLTQNSAP